MIINLIHWWNAVTYEKLYAVALVFFALYLGVPSVRLCVKWRKQEKQAAAEAAEKARRERERAEKQAAAQAAKAAEMAETPKRKRGRPRKTPAALAEAAPAVQMAKAAAPFEPAPAEAVPAVQPPKAAAPFEPEEAAAPVPAIEPEPVKPAALSLAPHGNRAFEGKRVAFTGTLPGMTRSKAIEAVKLNGGRAYTDMPLGVNLLVVGDNPGMKKLDIADEKIDRIRKITAAQFFAMLAQPLDVAPEEFAALAAQMKEVSHD